MIVSPAKPVGRPRDDAREAAILAATVTVLKAVGYDLLTIDAVAAEAKASKATVYRRWANKAELVVDALESQKATPEAGAGQECLFPDTGSLRGDLIAGLKAISAALSTDEGKVLAGVMTAMARDPELAAAMRATAEEKRRSCQLVVERAAARGEFVFSSRGVNAFVDVVPALMYNRLLVTGEPFDDSFVHYVVDDIALPLLTNKEVH